MSIAKIDPAQDSLTWAGVGNIEGMILRFGSPLRFGSSREGADRLLLDNMDPAELREAVRLVGGRVPLEASGGVTLETIRFIAETGVDYISVGRITQSAPAVDIGLDYTLG